MIDTTAEDALHHSSDNGHEELDTSKPAELEEGEIEEEPVNTSSTSHGGRDESPSARIRRAKQRARQEILELGRQHESDDVSEYLIQLADDIDSEDDDTDSKGPQSLRRLTCDAVLKSPHFMILMTRLLPYMRVGESCYDVYQGYLAGRQPFAIEKVAAQCRLDRPKKNDAIGPEPKFVKASER